MSDKHARMLSHPSNRARPKDVKEKKIVFKGVLDSPFRIQWPSVPLNLQNAILASVLQLLDGASDYHYQRSASSRKRKRAAKSSELSTPKEKRQKIDENDNKDLLASHSVVDTGSNPDASSCLERDQEDTPRPPPVLRHLIYGINAVTKRLEIQAQNARRPIVLAIPEISTALPPPLKYVFVCRADVDPALLIDHLPHLVAAYNSTHPAEQLTLVPFPQGSELVLAQTLGIRRVTVLGIDADYAEDQGLKSMMEHIPILAASWLSKPNPNRCLIPTHIKHLRTTAPKDMKAAKDLRNQEKALAKQKKRSNGEKSRIQVVSSK